MTTESYLLLVLQSHLEKQQDHLVQCPAPENDEQYLHTSAECQASLHPPFPVLHHTCTVELPEIYMGNGCLIIVVYKFLDQLSSKILRHNLHVICVPAVLSVQFATDPG